MDAENTKLLLLLIFAVAPVTLVLIVAFLRGYTVKFLPRQRRREDDDE